MDRDRGELDNRIIIKSKDVIPEQTNLLAVNATLDSARAEEAGKGFPVIEQSNATRTLL